MRHVSCEPTVAMIKAPIDRIFKPIYKEFLMSAYKNLGGNSNVKSFEIVVGGIAVTFNDNDTYLYTNEVTGRNNVETMARLAVQGAGLNSFINTNVRKMYARKLR